MALDLKKMLAVMVENEGSDLYLTFEASPSIKTQGALHPISEKKFASGEVHEIAASIMNDKQISEFDQTGSW